MYLNSLSHNIYLLRAIPFKSTWEGGMPFFYFSVGYGAETIFFYVGWGGGSLENKFCWGGGTQ